MNKEPNTDKNKNAEIRSIYTNWIKKICVEKNIRTVGELKPLNKWNIVTTFVVSDTTKILTCNT